MSSKGPGNKNKAGNHKRTSKHGAGLDTPQQNSSKGGRPTGTKKRIGELLVESGVIDRFQLKQALDAQTQKGGKLIDNLIYLGHLDSDKYIKFMAKQPGIPSISLKNCQIVQEVLALVSEKFAIEHEVFPIDKMGRLLTVGMVCPLDSKTINELESLTKLKVKPMLCTAAEIHHAVRRYYGDASPFEFMDEVEI